MLITHEMDIAEYGTRIVTFRDGQVVADRPVREQRLAEDELAAWDRCAPSGRRGPTPNPRPRPA